MEHVELHGLIISKAAKKEDNLMSINLRRKSTNLCLNCIQQFTQVVC